eukprot:514075_1
MSDNKSYSTIITILYASIYASIFFVTSIIAAIQVKKIRKIIKKSTTNNTQTQSSKITKSPKDNEEKKCDNAESIELEIKSNETHEEKDRTDAIISNQTYDPKQDSTYSKNIIKHWAKLLWSKKKVYWGLVPHIFDQATDFGVAVEYWLMYKNNEDVGGT